MDDLTEQIKDQEALLQRCAEDTRRAYVTYRHYDEAQTEVAAELVRLRRRAQADVPTQAMPVLPESLR